MEILAAILLLILIVVGIVFFIMAIIAITKLKKPEITVNDVKMATIMPYFGFGWLIGLIIYFTYTKKQIKGIPELEQVAENNNTLGIVGGIAYGALAAFLSFLSFGVISRGIIGSIADQSMKPDSSIEIMKDEEVKLPTEKSENAKTFEASTFAVDMDCAGSITKQSKENINTTLGMCVDINNGSFIAAETVVDMDSDVVNDEFIINSTIDGFFQGGGFEKTSTNKISSSEVIAEGKKDENKVLIKFLVKHLPDNRVAVYQLGITSPNEIDKGTFNNFTNSFRLK